MRKFLAVILAVIMSMTMLTGCGNDKAEVESVITAFMDDFRAGNLDNLLTYATGDAEEELKLVVADYQELATSLLEGVPGMEFEEGLLDNFMDAIFSKINYEVNSIEVDGREATVYLTVMIPDLDSVDINQMMTDALGISDESELLDKILESSGLDITALMTVTEEQINEILSAFIESLIVSLTDYINNNADALQTVTEETTIELTKIEGKWVISSSY